LFNLGQLGNFLIRQESLIPPWKNRGEGEERESKERGRERKKGTTIRIKIRN